MDTGGLVAVDERGAAAATVIGGATLHLGDCLDVMRGMPAASVDAVVTDPPYAEIDRPYGRLTEPEWWTLMRGVVGEVRRLLKPRGSAVFILQPNSERVGRMRPWLFDFMGWIARDWNMVQDAWWWNHATPPTVHCSESYGLMRPSLKACVWAGDSDCYRNQAAVLWLPSKANFAVDLEDRALRKSSSGSGVHTRRGRMSERAIVRNGSTPFNLLPISNANSTSSGGGKGHSAATPLPLCLWWVRYLTPSGGTVFDPFMGSGTTGVAALAEGFRFIGIERESAYFAIAEKRLRDATRQGSLFQATP